MLDVNTKIEDLKFAVKFTSESTTDLEYTEKKQKSRNGKLSSGALFLTDFQAGEEVNNQDMSDIKKRMQELEEKCSMQRDDFFCAV